MGYQDTPLPFACLACGWASVLVQLLRFNGRSHFCLARPAAKILSAARLLFLVTRLSIGGLRGSPLLEAALTTAPYAAAFLAYSLVIAPLCEARAQNAPNAFFMTNSPTAWRHFSRRLPCVHFGRRYLVSFHVCTFRIETFKTAPAHLRSTRRRRSDEICSSRGPARLPASPAPAFPSTPIPLHCPVMISATPRCPRPTWLS